jgi:hypothetical protein
LTVVVPSPKWICVVIVWHTVEWICWTLGTHNKIYRSLLNPYFFVVNQQL